MQILKLRTQNLKRIEMAEIEPSQKLIVIGGRNDQGKSSILDSIFYLLSGKKVLPSEPVKKGEKYASIVADLDNGYRIERIIYPDRSGKLNVYTKEGASFSSKETFLKSLLGPYGMLAEEFETMPALDQIEVLRSFITFDFKTYEEAYSKIYNERTETNSAIRNIQGELKLMPNYGAEVPDEPVNIVQVVADLDEFQAEINQRQELIQSIEQLSEKHENRATRISETQDLILNLRFQLNQANSTLSTHLEVQADLANKISASKIALESMPEPDLKIQLDLRNKLNTAQITNEKVNSKKQKARRLDNLQDEIIFSNTLTVDLEKLKMTKKTAFENSKLPIPGLTFQDNKIYLDEIPFNQLASSKRMDISIDIGIALNPKLKVLLIRNGSLLDENGLTQLQKKCEEKDIQIWLEKVSAKDGSVCEFYVEDGKTSKCELT